MLGSFACCDCELLQAANASAPARVTRDLRVIRSSSVAVTNVDARGCSLCAIDRLLGAFRARQGNSHAPVPERVRLGKNSKVDGLPRSADRQRLLDSLVKEGIALAIGEDHCRGGRADQLNGRNGQAEDRAQVQL